MILDANLSKRYWAEAVSTAVYLKNCCPTKTVQGKTPHEAWHEEKPKYAIFECLGVMHTPIFPKTNGESLTRTRKCILLGYGEETKGYRLYNVTKMKTLYSRGVQFDETLKNGEEVSSETETELCGK